MKNLSLKTLATYLNLNPDESLEDICIQGYAVDSRLVNPGDVFFALNGARVGGHEFLFHAVERGAIALVLEKGYQGDLPSVPVFRVDNSLEALQQLSHRFLQTWKPLLIGVTGSYGKTTTTGFIYQLLKPHFKVCKTYKNYNSAVGLPLSILRADGDEEILVLEMGMSEPGNIAKLVSIAPPDIGVLVSIGEAHRENFSSLEGIAYEKAAIFSHAQTSQAVLNADTPFYPDIVQDFEGKTLTYSHTHSNTAFTFESVGGKLKLSSQEGECISTSLPLEGLHYAQNTVAAALTAHAAGLSWEAIAEGVKHLSLPPRRYEMHKKSGVTLIDDAYNASPETMIAALNTLPASSQGRCIAVLGEMQELGERASSAYKEVAECALDKVDHLLCLGKETQPMIRLWEERGRQASCFMDHASLTTALKEQVRAEDTVLFKGSRASQLEKVVEEILKIL